MSRLGAVYYSTPEGGSGYIANPALPWLSSFNITQQAPVYDQETAWLRTSQPGTFTNYSRFGAPYSVDGGIQPPYYGLSAIDDPVPYDTSCAGMAGLGADGDLILRRADVVAPLPSITGTARSGCSEPVDPCETAVETVINNIAASVGITPANAPWLALVVVAGALLLLAPGKGSKK